MDRNNIRLTFIDRAKAVGILLMILGHCQYIGNIPGLVRIIYSFHMPLFFVISGMFIKPFNLTEGLKKYSIAYLKPYLVICSMLLVLNIALCVLFNHNISEQIVTSVESYFFASGSNQGTAIFHDLPKVGMIWFLFALFWGCLLYSYIKKMSSSILERFTLIFVLFFIGYISAKFIRLPFSLQAGFCSVPFLMAGDIIRTYKINDHMLSTNTFHIVCLSLLWIVSAMLFGGVNMAYGNFDEGIIQIPIAVLASLLLLCLCQKCKIQLNWLGMNTIYVLAGHQLFKGFCWQTDFNFDAIGQILPPPYAAYGRILITGVNSCNNRPCN